MFESEYCIHKGGMCDKYSKGFNYCLSCPHYPTGTKKNTLEALELLKFAQVPMSSNEMDMVNHLINKLTEEINK